MKISYVTAYNPHNVHNWSGTPFYLAKSLIEQDVKFDYIYGFDVRMGFLNRVKQLGYKLSGKNFDVRRTAYLMKQYAVQMEKMLSSDSQLIFAPSSLFFPFLKDKRPKVFYTDACYAGILDFYPAYSNLCKESIEIGHKLEQMSLDNSDMIIYSSHWAAKTAMENYKVNASKIHVVPFGANIEEERDYQTINSFIAGRSRSECHLLFCGVDWERKRGDFAVKVAEILNKSGLKTYLHVLGIRNLPPVPDFVIDHGFISKSTKEGKNKIIKIFTQAHFLLVPTRAEAYGLVFAEANSFGVPSIATDVGGVSTIIKNNINGQVFPIDFHETEYAKYIESKFAAYDDYVDLARGSFNEYQQRLNWNVAGQKIRSLLESLL